MQDFTKNDYASKSSIKTALSHHHQPGFFDRGPMMANPEAPDQFDLSLQTYIFLGVAPAHLMRDRPRSAT